MRREIKKSSLSRKIRIGAAIVLALFVAFFVAGGFVLYKASQQVAALLKDVNPQASWVDVTSVLQDPREWEGEITRRFSETLSGLATDPLPEQKLANLSRGLACLEFAGGPQASAMIDGVRTHLEGEILDNRMPAIKEQLLTIEKNMESQSRASLCLFPTEKS